MKLNSLSENQRILLIAALQNWRHEDMTDEESDDLDYLISQLDSAVGTNPELISLSQKVWRQGL